MRAGDDEFEQLRRAIDALAGEEVADLVAEARIEARAKVRSILAEAMAQALLERAQTELSPSSAPSPGHASRRWADRGARDQGAGPGGQPSDRPARTRVASESSASSAEASDLQASRRQAGRPERDAGAGAQEVTPAPQAHAPRPTTELGWYVYCVVGSEDVALDDLPGVDSAHPLSLLPCEGLAAVASQVPLDEFGENTLRDSLNDVAWLEDKARAHEDVLDHVRALTTVIPMRLCTIYRSVDSVREMLTREAGALTEALQRLAGKTEWGVKVFGETAAIARAAEQHSAALAELAAEIAQASPGEAYLLRRRLDELRREEVDQVVEERTHAIHARLSGAAVDALLNPLQPREVTNHEGDMFLNGVYLIDDAATEDFHGVLASLRDECAGFGFELQLTGPWPPYNFVKGSIEAAW